MPNSDFLGKGLGLIYPPDFLYDFFNISHVIYITWPNLIVWLSLFVELFSNRCIVFAYFPGRDVTNFETNLSFLIKPFSHMIEKLRTKTEIS